MKFFDKILKKLSEFVVKFRMPILGIFISLALLGVFGIFLTKINSDVLSYLPPDSKTAEGMAFLEENFGISGNALIAFDKNTEYGKIEDYVVQIEEIEGVTGVLWIGALDELNIGNFKLKNLAMIDEARERASEILMRDGNYLVMVNMSVGASTNEAGAIIDEIKIMLEGEVYALGGTAPISRQVYDDAIREIPIYLVVAVILVLILLFLTAHSWIEPVIFISTLGISVLINMGSNFIFGEISIITFAAAAILQLGLAMDYAIFLTHMYTEEKAKGIEPHQAVRNAVRRTFPTVCASALTTMGGMGALFLMSFTIGEDLGGVLLKGIALSLITVIVLQPCLLVLLDKTIDKSKKKALDFKFGGLAKFTVKNRIAVIIIFMVLLVPAYLGQHFLELSYMDFLPKPEETSELTHYVEDMGNQLFVAVPIDSDSLLEQKAYLERLNESDYISSVTGLLSILPDDLINEEGQIIILGLPFTKAVLSMGAEMGFVSNGYTLYTIALKDHIDVESAEAMQALFEIQTISEESFIEGFILTGIVQGVKDFQDITPIDFLKINFLSIGLILLILMLNFRSFKYPLLLVLLIQFGIWFNLSIDRLFGNSVNFLSYLVVGAIQLGATVDYAILVTSKYKECRKEGNDPLQAAYKSSTSASMSVLTSATIMMVACLSVAFIASNAVIREIAGLVARGAVISCVLVLCVLPSILSSSERLEQFIRDGGGVKGLTEKFLKELNEQAVRNAVKLMIGAEKIIENAKQLQEKTDHFVKDVVHKIAHNSKKDANAKPTNKVIESEQTKKIAKPNQETEKKDD